VGANAASKACIWHSPVLGLPTVLFNVSCWANIVRVWLPYTNRWPKHLVDARTHGDAQKWQLLRIVLWIYGGSMEISLAVITYHRLWNSWFRFVDTNRYSEVNKETAIGGLRGCPRTRSLPYHKSLSTQLQQRLLGGVCFTLLCF
jgi:hypothetical protein